MHLTKSFARRAFTLIEMLVVIALLLILLTVAAAMFPRFAENQRIVKGADQIQGWLLIAKQRALRDRRPTGIRFVGAPGQPITEMIYIQQADDYSGGRYVQPGPLFSFDPVRGYLCNFQGPGVDFFGAAGPSQPDLWTVQPGDYIEFFGGGLVHEISFVESPTSLRVHRNSSRPPFTPLAGTSNYRIIRQPRPVAGEAPLQLPQNIVVDTRPGRSRDLPQRNNLMEILFAPGGGVVGQGTTTGGNIILWVRDVTKEDNVLPPVPPEGSPLLVSIHTRTGLVAVHPVNTAATTPNDYYLFTTDGRSSGL